MLKNSKVVLFVTLKSWSGRKLLDPTTYVIHFGAALCNNCVSSSEYLNQSLTLGQMVCSLLTENAGLC